jgi:glutamate-1-semialdehyde 2,1-aminomutase
VVPDLAVFAKALGNGFPIGAVIGKAATMEAAQRSFISSTFWTEGVGPAAALACVRKMRRIDVPAHLARIGSLVRSGWQALGEKHRLPVKIGGRPEMALLSFDHSESPALLTLMTSRMLRRGFLAAGGFNPMLAHEEWHVTAYLRALDEVFAEMGEAIADGEIEDRIGGAVKHTGFARLT